jgi:Sigma 54 modulation protein / S30EA ribosomal protein
MQIQVNSDNNVAVDEEVTLRVEAEVNHALKRFANRITRVEVHLSDANGGKSGIHYKQCLIEARPAGHEPVAATDQAATLDEAIPGAAQKLQSILSSLFGRLGERT